MTERPPDPAAHDEPTAEFPVPPMPPMPPVPDGSPEPRFAGQPHATQQFAAPDYQPPSYAAPAFGRQPYPPEYPQYAPPPGSPWQAPDVRYDAPGWPSPGPDGTFAPPRGPRRGVVILVGVLVLALIGGVAAAIAVGSGDRKPSAGTAVPSPFAPNPQSSDSAGAQPSSPGSSPSPSLPPLGLVPTPPGLEAIGYHAYSLRLRDPREVALPDELPQFTRYGLSRVVGLRALTLGDSRVPGDDYDASINILKFRDAAAAKAELDFSNAENKKDGTPIALPGLPAVTAFVNRDEVDGISVGAFTTVGRYQVIVIVGGLSPNVITNSQKAAAEAARVLKAVLPDAATTVPDEPGTGPGPSVPSSTPSGTKA